MSDLVNLDRWVALAIIFLACFPVHEWAHAWTAYKLGDDTAARLGRLTLNPLAHLDPFGTIALVFAGFGWGKPVPVAPYRLRGNMRASWALVSFAGPFSNFVMAMLGAIPFRMGWVKWHEPEGAALSVQGVLVMFIFINLSLMLFNLIPIPPLDGSRILAWLLPSRWSNAMNYLERGGSWLLMLILILLGRMGIFSLVLEPLLRWLSMALLIY